MLHLIGLNANIGLKMFIKCYKYSTLVKKEGEEGEEEVKIEVAA